MNKFEGAGLPDWFDWKKYEALGRLSDRSVWAYLFAIRNPEFQSAFKNGMGFKRTLDTKDDLDKIPRLYWRDGVLSLGMYGHKTHEYLKSVYRLACKNAVILTEDEFQQMDLSKSAKKGTIITTGKSDKDGMEQHVRLMFSSKNDYDEFKRNSNAVTKNTMEFAINPFMPKKILLKEIERLIDNRQKNLILPLIKKIKSDTSLCWSRGLACWDLIEEDSTYTHTKLARYLVPLWFDQGPSLEGDPTDDSYKSLVNRVLKATRPYIDGGGWKILAGDPLVSFDNNLVN